MSDQGSTSGSTGGDAATTTTERLPAIGIDFGTTHCCVAVWQDGRVEVIPDAVTGKTAFPSAVAFVPVQAGQFQISVGDEAIAQGEQNPAALLYCIKRFLARKATDSFIRKGVANWPFKVVSGRDERVRFEVDGTQVAVEEACSYVLKRAKSNAEQFLAHPVRDAVVTVPAHFNDIQRQAIREAGALAGLNVIRIVSESTAACLAYGHELADPTTSSTSTTQEDRMSLEEDSGGDEQTNVQPQKERKVIMIDLGGGFLNVSVVVIDEGVYQVLAVSGSDANLGGEDFTQRLVNYFEEEVKRVTRGYDMRTNPTSITRLRAAIEKFKKALSEADSVELNVQDLGDDNLKEVPNFWLDRKRFQEITTDLCAKIFIPIEQVLRDAKMSKEDIDEVVLMGGTMAMPRLNDMLSEYFNSHTGHSKTGTRVYKRLSSDQTLVARGAAIQAAIMSGIEDRESGQENAIKKRKKTNTVPLRDTLLLDVISNTLGVNTAGGIMTPIIHRNTSVPVTHSRFFTLDIPPNWNVSGTSKLALQIFEGENALTSKNNFLDEVELDVHLGSESSHVKIEVRFTLDVNSLLKVTATQIETTAATDEDEEPHIQVLSREELAIHYGTRRRRATGTTKQKEPTFPASLRGKALSSELSASLTPVYYHQHVEEAPLPQPT